MKRSLLTVLAGLVLVAGACSGDPEPATGTPTIPPPTTAPSTTEAPVSTIPPVTATHVDDGFPVTIEHDGGVATVESRPARIAALSATHVEMLFAIGAGPQVIAGDLFSNHPAGEVAGLQLIDSFNLSVEAVIDLDPDLVVLSFDPVGAVEAFETVGIPVVLFGTAADLESVYAQILAMGEASGRRPAAERLAGEMHSGIEEIVAAALPLTSGMSFYHESDPFSYYTPNSASFIGGLYSLLGMVNIADEAPDELNSGFPQLSAEFIVASDPEVVFLAGFGETPETFSGRDGWESMSAVAAGSIVVLDFDVASRWGPRVVDLLQSIADGALTAGGG